MNPILPNLHSALIVMTEFGYMIFCTSDTLRDHIPFATSVGISHARSLLALFVRILIAVTIVRLTFLIYTACSDD
jgi:hypothetical protein